MAFCLVSLFSEAAQILPVLQECSFGSSLSQRLSQHPACSLLVPKGPGLFGTLSRSLILFSLWPGQEWGLRSSSIGLMWHCQFCHSCPVSGTRDGDRVKDRGHTGMGSVQGGDRIVDSLPAAR